MIEIRYHRGRCGFGLGGGASFLFDLELVFSTSRSQKSALERVDVSCDFLCGGALVDHLHELLFALFGSLGLLDLYFIVEVSFLFRCGLAATVFVVVGEIEAELLVVFLLHLLLLLRYFTKSRAIASDRFDFHIIHLSVDLYDEHEFFSKLQQQRDETRTGYTIVDQRRSFQSKEEVTTR